MIEIDIKVRDNRTFDLLAVGHSGAAAHGSDIVCAAVSALLYTLAAQIEDYDQKAMLEDKAILLGSGEGGVYCEVSAKYARYIRSCYKMIARGLIMLAETYPDNVRIATDWGYALDSPPEAAERSPE